jgi:hypothetical protein
LSDITHKFYTKRVIGEKNYSEEFHKCLSLPEILRLEKLRTWQRMGFLIFFVKCMSYIAQNRRLCKR